MGGRRELHDAACLEQGSTVLCTASSLKLNVNRVRHSWVLSRGCSSSHRFASADTGNKLGVAHHLHCLSNGLRRVHGYTRRALLTSPGGGGGGAGTGWDEVVGGVVHGSSRADGDNYITGVHQGPQGQPAEACAALQSRGVVVGGRGGACRFQSQTSFECCKGLGARWVTFTRMGNAVLKSGIWGGGCPCTSLNPESTAGKGGCIGMKCWRGVGANRTQDSGEGGGSGAVSTTCGRQQSDSWPLLLLYFILGFSPFYWEALVVERFPFTRASQRVCLRPPPPRRRPSPRPPQASRRASGRRPP